MPDTRHLTICPPTFCNVSYSWHYGLTSCLEDLFKEVTPSTWSSYSSKLWEWDGNPQHTILLLHASQHLGWPDTHPPGTVRHMSLWPSGSQTWRTHWMEEDKEWSGKEKEDQENKGKSGKIVQLKRELQLMHKQSQTKSGMMGIIWWNMEYWDNGMGLKRLQKSENGLTVNKEEPSTPLLHVKVESPPTPCLHYPPSSMSSSHFHSIDPNDFAWSNSPTP